MTDQMHESFPSEAEGGTEEHSDAPSADMTDAVNARRWARENSKLSNNSLGNIQIRMRAVEQNLSNVLRPYRQNSTNAP